MRWETVRIRFTFLCISTTVQVCTSYQPESVEFLEKYEVPTIPALKVLNADGSIAIADARNQVQDKGRDEPVQLFDEWLKEVKA
ncbi:hypothetical protein GCK32_019538 [Trichostrongylus colubriformis]|uniref:Uncharacterized protein n=1 Tax=Trichostrongylus colubriformis TaxID=6319 RepID=A0AAN8G206_TRICO